MTVKTRIAIDPNIRVRGNATFAGFEDVQGSPVHLGAIVEVFEPESGIVGIGEVVEIDEDRKLIFLAVDWASLKPRLQAVPVGVFTRATVPNLMVLDTEPCLNAGRLPQRGGRIASAAVTGLLRVV